MSFKTKIRKHTRKYMCMSKTKMTNFFILQAYLEEHYATL